MVSAQKNPGPSGEVSPEEPGRILSQYINPSALGVKAHLGVMMIVMVLKCISSIGHDSSRLYRNDINDLLFVCQVLFFTNSKKMMPTHNHLQDRERRISCDNERAQSATDNAFICGIKGRAHKSCLISEG